MTNIVAGSSPGNSSAELRSPNLTLGFSRRSLRLRSESRVLLGLARTESTVALQHDPISRLSPSHATRNRVTNRIAANLLKTNDWHTCYPKLKQGGPPEPLSCESPLNFSTFRPVLAVAPRFSNFTFPFSARHSRIQLRAGRIG